MRSTISQIYFVKELCVFRTDLRPSSGVSTLTSLADSQHNYHDKYLLLRIQCWDSWWWTV